VRWDSGWGYKKNKHFWDAIQKYGWHSFDHEILFSDLAPEEAYLKEQEMIQKYESCDYRKGYNNSSGGECGALGCTGERHHMYEKHHTPETIERIREKKRGIPWSGKRRQAIMEAYDSERRRTVAYRTIVGYNKGKPHSEEWRLKIAESNRGQKRSQETKNRLSETHKIPVIQLSRDGEFIREWDCAKTAAAELNVQAGHISKVCKNQRKTAGGFVWKYK